MKLVIIHTYQKYKGHEDVIRTVFKKSVFITSAGEKG